MPLPASPLDPVAADHRTFVTSSDGTALHVEVRGPEDAPTVVLVHGWTTTSDSWTLQYRDLAGPFRVVSYDQRGHGRSGPPGRRGWAPEALPDDLLQVIETMVPPGEKALVVGHSLGAMTVIAAAGLRPELVHDRIGGAVLASTAVDELLVRSRVVPMPLPVAKAARVISGQVIGARVKVARRPDPISRAVVKYTNFSDSATPEQVEFAARQILSCDGRVRGEVGRMLGRMDLSPHLAALDLPVVVIGGDADRLTPVWHARRLAERLPHVVEYLELPGVGHMTPLQAPEAIAGAVERLAARYLAGAR